MKETQDQIHEWSTRNFGRSVDVQKYVNISSFLGMVEELGEISHAILKMAQGISGSERKHWADIEDGIADLVVFCLDFCARQETVGHPLDAEELLLRVWAKVRQRDFRQDPLTGGREAIEGMDGTELAAHMGEVQRPLDFHCDALDCFELHCGVCMHPKSRCCCTPEFPQRNSD